VFLLKSVNIHLSTLSAIMKANTCKRCYRKQKSVQIDGCIRSRTHL